MNTTDWPARRILCIDQERCAMPVCSCKECPVPQACELPDAESMKHFWTTQRRFIGGAIAVTVVLSMLAIVR